MKLHQTFLASLLVLQTVVLAAPTNIANPMTDTAQPLSGKNLLPDVQDPQWKTWHPPSLPEFQADKTDDTLVLKTDRPESYARWTTQIAGITPGATYEFSIEQKPTGVDLTDLHLPLELSWFVSPEAQKAIQRNHIDQQDASSDAGGGWQRLTQRIKSPPEATSVSVALGLRWRGGASVSWRNPRLVEVAPLAPRKVRVATTHIVPPSPSTVEANTKLMADMLDLIGKEKPDIVVFSENLVDRYEREPIDNTAQTIPGPLTQMLSEKARLHNTYIVTSLNEKDAKGHLYVTAVLIDREGKIAGTYRKVHLPLDEAERGLLPGSEYPVFDTDFGRVGLLVCWDNWFPEAARIMRLQGAEMILLPIAGDSTPGHWDATSKSRAMENVIYMVSSITTPSVPSQIINPAGQVVGEAVGDFCFVVEEIDLNEQWKTWYRTIGGGKGDFYIKERRPDTYQRLLNQ